MFSSSKIGSGSEYIIGQSLRFRASASPSLTRTPASSSNRTTWTFSFWYKANMPTGTQRAILCAGTSTGNDVTLLAVENQTLRFYHYTTATVWQLIPTQLFRDPSAWYHIVAVLDTGNATSTDRARLYVNGTRITSFSSATYPTLNYATSFVNANVLHRIGVQDFYHDFYLADVNLIDGQALTPSSFGQTNPTTGVWEPRDYLGTYGTNGFHLTFSDNSAATAAALGKDSSGNSNNWTPNNISLTTDSTYDWMTDTPTQYDDGGYGRGNYATLSPLSVGTGTNSIWTFSNANLSCTSTSGGQNQPVYSTIGVTSGKWYAEITPTQANSIIGVGYYLSNSQAPGWPSANSVGYVQNGQKFTNATLSAYGSSYTSGDVIGIALDMDAGTCVFYKNNVSQGIALSGITTSNGEIFFQVSDIGSSAVYAYNINFGQRPFNYAPPSGFKALNTFNLPEPLIDNGSRYFDVTLYTGNGTTQSPTNSGGFQPDFVWIKERNAIDSHMLFDSVRGATNVLNTNNTTDQSTNANTLTAFNSSGFSVGSDTSVNANTSTYVAWQWDENPVSGFDIVTYTGTGVEREITHNLGVAPSMMIVKTVTAAGFDEGWQVYHSSLSSASVYMELNNTNGENSTNGVGRWNATAPTSSVFTVGTNQSVNASGATYVAYLFAEVPGFSSFGSYTGNGSTDGPFVFCGFRPRFVMIKRTDAADNWMILDSARNTVNPNDVQLAANLTTQEGQGATTGNATDFLSNGFKSRTTGTRSNGSGGTYIYAAFAENPFKYALAR